MDERDETPPEGYVLVFDAHGTPFWAPPDYRPPLDPDEEPFAEALEREAPPREAPAFPREGYRRASDDTWALARRDYLAGDTAEAVCDRYGLRPGTLRHRAATEGWRRVDQPDPEPVDLEAETAAGLPDPAQMARHALVRLNRAVLRGRAAEAASWMRLYEKLAALAEAAREAASKAARKAAQGTARETAQGTTPETARQAAPDPSLELARRAADIGRLARDVAALDPRDARAVAAIEARMAALDRPGDDALCGPFSDDSDNSDPVFPPPGSESSG